MGVTLTDADGDGIYEGSLVVDAGTYEYVHALTGSEMVGQDGELLDMQIVHVQFQGQIILALQ